MALATASGLASFDQAAGEYLDLSNELAEIIRRDNTAILQRIGISGVATETTHSWMEDSLNANSVVIAEAMDGSETDLDVTAGQGVRLQIGSLLRNQSEAGKTEVMQVTAITTDTATVVRGYGSTTAETHSSGSTFQIIANPKQENQDMPSDESKIRTKVSNFTQIFQKGVNVSHTMRQVMQAGVPDEFSFQIARRLQEIHRELDSSVILGIKSADAGSDSSVRSMGGLIEFTSQASGNINSTSEALSPSVINTMVKQIWDDGGRPDFILVGGKQKRVISTFDQSARRSTLDTTVAGYVVDKFMSDLGFTLDIIVDPWMPDDTIIVGELGKIRVMPLQGDAMRSEDIAKTGRGWKNQVTGQYTLEVRNAKEAFAYHNNLT